MQDRESKLLSKARLLPLLAFIVAGALCQTIQATIDAARTRPPISKHLYGQ